MQRGTPACEAECFCDACGVDSHATDHCEAFKDAEARPGGEHDGSLVDNPASREDGHGEGDDRGGGGEPNPAAATVPTEAGAESASAAASTSAAAAQEAPAEGETAAPIEATAPPQDGTAAPACEAAAAAMHEVAPAAAANLTAAAGGGTTTTAKSVVGLGDNGAAAAATAAAVPRNGCMVFRLSSAAVRKLKVGASIDVVTEDAPLSDDVQLEPFFHDEQDYDLSFTLESVMRSRPNAYCCKLERTESGFKIDEDEFCTIDEWIEKYALGFGRIVRSVDPNVTDASAASAAGADASAAPGAAAVIEPEPIATRDAAALVTALKSTKGLDAPGGAVADGPAPTVTARAKSARTSKPPTAYQSEAQLSDDINHIRELVNGLSHYPYVNRPEYLLAVVSYHCATPASGRGAILTTLRRHGRAQVAVETKIAGIRSDLDAEKTAELDALVDKLKARVPPPPPKPPAAKVPDETVMNFDKLIDNFASLATDADITGTNGLRAVMMEIGEFVLGIVAVVRKHGAGLQQNNNRRAYDHRATAAFHLFTTDQLLVQVPDDSSCPRMVNFLGDAYYHTQWRVHKVRLCSFRRTVVVGFSRSLTFICRHLCRRCSFFSTAAARSRTWTRRTAECTPACTTDFRSRSTSSWGSAKTAK